MSSVLGRRPRPDQCPGNMRQRSLSAICSYRHILQTGMSTPRADRELNWRRGPSAIIAKAVGGYWLGLYKFL